MKLIDGLFTSIFAPYDYLFHLNVEKQRRIKNSRRLVNLGYIVALNEDHDLMVEAQLFELHMEYMLYPTLKTRAAGRFPY